MYTNIALQRYWGRLVSLCRYSTAVEGQKLPDVSKSIDGISPPPRIPRGPTDILQALAATVGNDPTAAHYKYHDDPYLTPLSNYRKRAYALSAEAGRKAAVWIRDEHAEWFTTRVWDPPLKIVTPHFNADPKIPAYAPKPIYNDESKVTIEDLKHTINNGLVEDSIKVYQLLGGSENISEELKLSLLQLLCFYNEKEPESLEWTEERWFAAVNKEKHSVTWKLGGLSEQIFNSLEPKTPDAYCSIIQGMAKYYQAERAHQLEQEASEKGITLSTSTYNMILASIGFLYEGTALRVEQLESKLRHMVDQGVSPNSGTLTACLKSLSAWGSSRILQDKALQLIADFKSMGIQPGLAAYHYVLCIFCKERGPRVDILTSILRDLESRPSLKAEHPTDTQFFITAMAICNNHLEDMTLAEKVHSILMKGDNYKLVGDAYKESIYYRHLVTVACKRAPLEKTLQLLDELVPNVYVPEPSVMEKIIDTLEVGGVGDRLAQAWSQLVVFGLARRTSLVEKVLSAMCNCYQFQDAEVKQKMRAAALDVLKYVKESEEELEFKDIRSPPNRLSASALCNVIDLCSSDAEGSDECWSMIKDALQRLHSGEATGAPTTPGTLATVATRAASVGQNSVASAAVAYLAEYGFEEASTASVEVLSTILNRSQDEVLEMLRQPRAEFAANLNTSCLAIVDTYLSSEGATKKSQRQDSTSSSSSESDSEVSDSDDERK